MTAICTEDDTLTALLLLRETVPGEHPEISQQTAQVWHVSLALYPGDVVRHVALHWPGETFPSREEFRDAVSAEQRTRRETEARKATENPEDHPACPSCDGYGWAVLSTAPWIVEPCPTGCLPPLPRHRQDGRARRRRPLTDAPPQRVSPAVIETTSRIVGDRDGF
jgi:hypothetical protein